jgi:drug/metabolite transporter (DMT)-like permease
MIAMPAKGAERSSERKKDERTMTSSHTDTAADPGSSDAATPAKAVARAISSETIGFALAAAGAILFSTKAVAIKIAYRDAVDAETLLALRMALASPFYLAIGIASLRDRRRTGRPLPSLKLFASVVGVGLLGYWLSSYLDFLGLEFVTAQAERLILFTYPLFVVLFGRLFFGQRVTRRALVAVAISYVGLIIIFGDNMSIGGHGALIGSLLVLAAAVFFALYQLVAKNLISETGPRLFTCIAMLAAAAGAFIQFFLTHAPSDLAVSGEVWLTSLYIAIGATVLPTFFMNAALHRISAQANATIGTLSPVATIVLAYFILGERLSPAAWAGTALVLAGVGWFTYSASRR